MIGPTRTSNGASGDQPWPSDSFLSQLPKAYLAPNWNGIWGVGCWQLGAMENLETPQIRTLEHDISK